MAETIIIDKSESLDDEYKSLIKQVKSLLSKDDKQISNISNFIGALKQTFDKISWVGFYFSRRTVFILVRSREKLPAQRLNLVKVFVALPQKKERQ